MPLSLPPPHPLFFSASSSSSPLHFSSISQPCLVNGFSSNLFYSLSSPPHIQVPNPSSKFIVPFSRDSSSVFFLPSLFLPRLEPSFKPRSLPHTSNKLARLIAGLCREQCLQRVPAIRQGDRDANEANDDNGSGSAHPLTDREYSSEGQVEALDSSGTGFGSNENGAMGSCVAEERPLSEQKRIRSNVSTLLRRFWKVAAPYWSSEDKVQARLRLAAVFALTLGTTGISVGFNFLGRDFYNALASKDQEQFTKQLLYYLGAFAGGIPVFVLRDYGRDTLALRWRAWMTSYYMDRYFKNRTFYQIQSQSLIDNPDQRIVDDLNSFSGTALSFSLALFNATIDLISFSGILFGIYPPLFLVLIVYSIGGTAISIALGKDLVNLNFLQEKKEADFRYGLVRVRENAESIAFYGGEKNEIQLLLLRFRQSFENFSQLLVASRNLEFFTSGYRYLIQILPAALVAPMYFSGKIEFGVINQSYSAFNHVLGDFSIIVYQFQAISAFSAVIDRLGEFGDILDQQNGLIASSTEDKRLEKSLITMIVVQVPHTNNIMPTETNYFSDHPHLLEIEHLTLQTPQYTMTLVKDLSLVVQQGQNLLIMGASGSGKTSLMRAIAGLWRSGSGLIKWYLLDEIVESDGTFSMRENMEIVHESVTSRQKQARHLFDAHEATEDEAKELHGKGCSSSLSKQGMVFFLPQRPYLVLGTLRQQLLYPTWVGDNESNTMSSEKDSLQIFSQPDKNLYGLKRPPTDEELVQVLEAVRMGHLMDRCDGLDSNVDWTSVLSLGEQQRIAFARLLLSRPRLALLDESTSAMDETNEAHLYKELENAGITYISIGHRSSLRQFHLHVLTIHEATRESPGQNWILEHLNEPDASKPFSPLNV